MNEDVRARLRRLGVAKGTHNLKPAPPREDGNQLPVGGDQLSVGSDRLPVDDDRSSTLTLQPLDVLLPGIKLEETAEGTCFVLDKVYPLVHQHGDDRLAGLLNQTPATAALFCRDKRLENLDFRDFLFLDTETTGLAGAGVIAFMVGVAFFEREALVVRQYFLRDYGDEPAMLLLLDGLLAQKAGLITFNGRSFDLPLLDSRYLMKRMPGAILDQPHIDLLPPSRRLWRNRLGSCALGSLEKSLLGLQRTHEDVPGWLIPALYRDYLLTGDGRELLRVFYHNEIDMLSMVTLAARITRLFATPGAGDHPIDLFSLGKWQADLGLTAAAEQNLRRAAAGDLPLELYHKALGRLGLLLKRDGRHPEAVPLWQQIAATSFDDVAAHVELAKFYEWRERDLPAAINWTQRALALTNSWRSPGRAALAREELAHRLARLQRKNNSLIT